ncbi:hypothetical protein ACFOW1_01635 [Parasediminibacterium paludis]|uniref:Uncharacterized protein n=1 Tax=Parasediminibacterium paludis TaxID=908966 RepID=A0ABV8PTV7_9BACT
MRKDGSNWEKTADKIAITLFFVMFLIALFGLHSCNSAKIIERKDNAAFERVTAKRSLLDKIAPVVQGIYPCANDTFFKTTRDTTITHDTAISYIHSHDTVNKVRVDTLKVKFTTTKVIHDTALIVDKQKAAIDAKTIQNQALTIAALNQNVSDLTATNNKQSSKITWLIVACVLGGIVILGLLYLLFKPK